MLFSVLRPVALVAIFLGTGWVAHAQNLPGPVYACVVLNGNFLQTYQVLGAGQVCPPGQSRMLVVTQKTQLFAANSSQPSTEASRVFVAKFLPNFVSIPNVAPLTIVVSLDVDTEEGRYVIPLTTDTVTGLSCVPLVDGQPAGATLALSTMAAALGGRLPGTSPDTLWSIARESTVSLTGRHEIEMECGAGAAFHFRGVATFTVFQQVPGS